VYFLFGALIGVGRGYSLCPVKDGEFLFLMKYGGPAYFASNVSPVTISRYLNRFLCFRVDYRRERQEMTDNLFKKKEEILFTVSPLFLRT
jgi:hypothetical protein